VSWNAVRIFLRKLEIFKKLVIGLGSLHLTLMAAIGIWLWSSPIAFECSQPGMTSINPFPIECTSVSILGGNLKMISTGIRAWSLILYSIFLIPGLNLLIPALLFLWLYNALHDHKSTLGFLRHPGILPVLIGLLILAVINVIFVISIELTISGAKIQQQPGESEWTFGQTLALLLLSLPLRDTAILQTLRQEQKMDEAIAKDNVSLIRELASRWQTNSSARTKGIVSTLIR
jgi:hypothetical protein